LTDFQNFWTAGKHMKFDTRNLNTQFPTTPWVCYYATLGSQKSKFVKETTKDRPTTRKSYRGLSGKRPI